MSLRAKIVQMDNLDWLKREAKLGNKYPLVYVDPLYDTKRIMFEGDFWFDDDVPDYMAFMTERLQLAYAILEPTGSLLVHCDQVWGHYLKVLMDRIFGRASFMNEIIWAWDYGQRATKLWPAKHNTIFWYAKNPKSYCFNGDECDRIEYMAPKMCGEAKAANGKLPTDVWWMTIVSPISYERLGYPTQKPINLLNRIVKVHSNPGDTVVDFFGGSGTTADSALLNGRNTVYVDQSAQAVYVATKRIKDRHPNVLLEIENGN